MTKIQRNIETFILKIILCYLFLFCYPLKSQNVASIEVPFGIAFVYGLHLGVGFAFKKQ